MSKFKIGDKVRVLCNTTNDKFDEVEIGDIGMVVEICKDDKYPIGLKINNYNPYMFKEEELELVNKNDFKSRFDKKNNTYALGEYPIGLLPKDMWLKARKQDILDAIERYSEAEIVIPLECAKELRELEERGV